MADARKKRSFRASACIPLLRTVCDRTGEQFPPPPLSTFCSENGIFRRLQSTRARPARRRVWLTSWRTGMQAPCCAPLHFSLRKWDFSPPSIVPRPPCTPPGMVENSRGFENSPMFFRQSARSFGRHAGERESNFPAAPPSTFHSGKWDFPPPSIVPRPPCTPPGMVENSRGFENSPMFFRQSARSFGRHAGERESNFPAAPPSTFHSGKWDFPPPSIVPRPPCTPPGTVDKLANGNASAQLCPSPLFTLEMGLFAAFNRPAPPCTPPGMVDKPVNGNASAQLCPSPLFTLGNGIFRRLQSPRAALHAAGYG